MASLNGVEQGSLRVEGLAKAHIRAIANKNRVDCELLRRTQILARERGLPVEKVVCEGFSNVVCEGSFCALIPDSLISHASEVFPSRVELFTARMARAGEPAV